MESGYAPFLDWIDARQPMLVETLCRWAGINSGTFNLPGLERQCDELAAAFGQLGEVSLREGPPCEVIDPSGVRRSVPLGKHLHVVKRPDAPLQVLLGIHMDTVYGADSPFQTYEFLDDNTLNGPGVCDAKGGLLVMLTALEAFERFVADTGHHRIGWQVLINSDEEIGSPGSDVLFRELAPQVQLGLLYEPAMGGSGHLVSARRGSGNFSVVVRGRSAHAGRDFEQGRNAVAAAGRLAAFLDGLNGNWPGVTINVSRIDGGGPHNMVPDLAILRINIRCVDREQEQLALDALREELPDLLRQDGFDVSIHGAFLSPPKPLDESLEELLSALTDCGRDIGLSIRAEPSGGTCDGNRLAAYGVPNVDSLGVRGGKIHSPDEFVSLDSLTERAKLTALFLMRLADESLSLPFLMPRGA